MLVGDSTVTDTAGWGKAFADRLLPGFSSRWNQLDQEARRSIEKRPGHARIGTRLPSLGRQPAGRVRHSRLLGGADEAGWGHVLVNDIARDPAHEGLPKWRERGVGPVVLHGLRLGR